MAVVPKLGNVHEILNKGSRLRELLIKPRVYNREGGFGLDILLIKQHRLGLENESNIVIISCNVFCVHDSLHYQTFQPGLFTQPINPQ